MIHNDRSQMKPPKELKSDCDASSWTKLVSSAQSHSRTGRSSGLTLAAGDVAHVVVPALLSVFQSKCAFCEWRCSI